VYGWEEIISSFFILLFDGSQDRIRESMCMHYVSVYVVVCTGVSKRRNLLELAIIRIGDAVTRRIVRHGVGDADRLRTVRVRTLLNRCMLMTIVRLVNPRRLRYWHKARLVITRARANLVS
jgi:hypothetical protein